MKLKGNESRGPCLTLVEESSVVEENKTNQDNRKWWKVESPGNYPYP